MSDLVHIRAMLPQDLEPVMRLEKAVPEAPHWTSEVYLSFLAVMIHDKQIFIAEKGSNLLGYAAAQIILDVCELESIVVDATARRLGVGRALLNALFDWASGNKAARVYLEVRGGNNRAVDFYMASGFARDGLRPGYYRDPQDDAVLMSKALEPAASRE